MERDNRIALRKYAYCESLPGFAEAKKQLEEKGRPSDWLTNVVDTSDSYAIFLKKGKIHYKSSCPHYEGYWLDGGTGSVQCQAADGLLPGLQWSLFCEKNCTACKFYREREHT